MIRTPLWVVLAVLVFLAAFLRLAHQREVAERDLLARAPAGDERTFVEWAHAAAAGKDDSIPYQAPLYPTLLGTLERAGADVGRDARLLQALLGLVAAGLAGLAAFEATNDRRAAVVAFFLAAFARPLIHAEGTLLREGASAAVLAAVALALARARARGKLEDHAALGLALGLGVVLRENFSVVALVVLAERALALGRRRETLLRLAVFVAALALPVLPFDVKVARLGGGAHLVPNWNQGCVFYLANRRDNRSAGGYEPPPFLVRGSADAEVEGFTAEARRRTGRELRGHEVGAYWLGEGLREAGAAPGLFAWRVGMRALYSLAPWEMAHQRDLELDAERSWVLSGPLLDMGALIALAVVGAFFARGPREGAIRLVAASWWLSLLFAAFTTRYRVPAIPVLAVLGALGARSAARFALSGRYGGLVLLGVVLLGLEGLRAFRPPEDHANAIRTRGLAALELASNAPEGVDARDLFKTGAGDLARALSLHPGDEEVRLDLARAWSEVASRSVKDPVAAREAWEQVVRYAPDFKPAWHFLAISELILKRPRAALAALAHADQADPEVQRHLAIARERAGSAEDRPLPLPRR